MQNLCLSTLRLFSRGRLATVIIPVACLFVGLFTSSARVFVDEHSREMLKPEVSFTAETRNMS